MHTSIRYVLHSAMITKIILVTGVYVIVRYIRKSGLLYLSCRPTEHVYIYIYMQYVINSHYQITLLFGHCVVSVA